MEHCRISPQQQTGLEQRNETVCPTVFKAGADPRQRAVLDSTKIRANAGKAHQHKKQWYQKQLKKIDQRIAELLEACERTDQQEAEQGSLVKMPKQLKSQTQLKASIEAALAEFANQSERTKDGNLRQVNRTDPQSRQMKSRQGTHPSHSVQSVVDNNHGLIVHVAAVNDANDSSQLADQIKSAERNLDKECTVACADAGYSNIEQIEQIESDERKVIVPSQRQASDKPDGPFDKSQFVFEPDHDCYFCPEGHRLIFRRFQDKALKKRVYRIKKPGICVACTHFGICTKSRQGRSVVRHVSEALKQTVEARYHQPAWQRVYSWRKSRVEHPFGYIKKVLSFTQFSLRGHDGAQAEASVLAVCFNLRRMISIFGGAPQLIAAMATV